MSAGCLLTQHHSSKGSLPSSLSGLGAWVAGGAMSGGNAPPGSALPPAAPPLASQSSLRRRSKVEIADCLLNNLRQRGMDVDSGSFAADLRAHFESLPSRCAAAGGRGGNAIAARARAGRPPPGPPNPAGMRWTSTSTA